MTALRRMSVKVVPAPMVMASGVASMKRSSLRWWMERSEFLAEAAGGEGDHELGAAGDGGVAAGVGGEERAGLRRGCVGR